MSKQKKIRADMSLVDLLLLVAPHKLGMLVTFVATLLVTIAFNTSHKASYQSSAVLRVGKIDFNSRGPAVPISDPVLVVREIRDMSLPLTAQMGVELVRAEPVYVPRLNEENVELLARGSDAHQTQVFLETLLKSLVEAHRHEFDEIEAKRNALIQEISTAMRVFEDVKTRIQSQLKGGTAGSPVLELAYAQTTASFAQLVQEKVDLERARLPPFSWPTQVLSPATRSTKPVSPTLTQSFILGVLLSFLASLAYSAAAASFAELNARLRSSPNA